MRKSQLQESEIAIMKYYAVIDTNVLVSAMLKWDSVPGNIMELVFSGTIIPLLNEQIVKEYKDVLSRPKFHFTHDIIYDVIDEIERLGIYIDAEKLDTILPDPKDKIFMRLLWKNVKPRTHIL